MKRKNRALAALLLLLLALPAACKKEEKAAPPPEPQKPAPQKPAQPAPGVQNQATSAKQPARIDFGRKTDPFKAYAPAAAPPAAPQAAPQAAPIRIGEQLPIQSFDVAKFKLVGIIAGINQNRALLIDPTGKGYVVQEGMEIGTSQGRITRITASSVEVIESFKADNGRIKKRKVVLTLAKKR